MFSFPKEFWAGYAIATTRIFVTAVETWGNLYVVQNSGAARNFIREETAT